MPHLIFAPSALAQIDKCRRFLAENSPSASRRAMQAIRSQLRLLTTVPHAGRQVQDEDDLRELVIDFGNSGYVALYSFSPAQDAVYILAFRHQREAGY